jgi:hypothetical protein
VAAFYAFAKRCFYRRRPFHHGRLEVRLLLLRFRPQLETIVHRGSEILLAAEIPLRRLHPGVTTEVESVEALGAFSKDPISNVRDLELGHGMRSRNFLVPRRC